jgi:hypothetical protein
MDGFMSGSSILIHWSPVCFCTNTMLFLLFFLCSIV